MGRLRVAALGPLHLPGQAPSLATPAVLTSGGHGCDISHTPGFAKNKTRQTVLCAEDGPLPDQLSLVSGREVRWGGPVALKGHGKHMAHRRTRTQLTLLWQRLPRVTGQDVTTL